jgi:hypothetical protein
LGLLGEAEGDCLPDGATQASLRRLGADAGARHL